MSAAAIPYRSLRLCSTGGGHEALPNARVALDLSAVRRALSAHGIEAVDARVLLVVPGDPELTVARSGRVLIKSDDPRVALAAFERFCAVAGLNVRWATPPSGVTG